MEIDEIRIDPEIRALTQLVSSFIRKRSALNYQINQLKLAQNTKKTCIETKKLRDLKAKNANLVVEIKNSEKILDKIKQKKYIKLKDKDLSQYLKNFQQLLFKKHESFNTISEDLIEATQYLDKKKQFSVDRKSYLGHLQEKHETYKLKLKKVEKLLRKNDQLEENISSIKEKLEKAKKNKEEISEKHQKLLAKRRLRRRATRVIPMLPPNVFLLRSKYTLKNELTKQLSEMKSDISQHEEQQEKLQVTIQIPEEDRKDLEVLKKLKSDRELLKNVINRYTSEIDLLQNSPSEVVEHFIHLKEQDSLRTDSDDSDDSSN